MNETVATGAEQRRRDYLKLMGIQPWYAKVALENAKASPVVAVLPEADALKMPNAARKEAPPSGREAARAPKPRPKSQPKPEPGREAAPVPVRKPLHYLRIDDSLAVLADDGWEGAEGERCRELLANILKALGKTLDSGAAGEPAHINRDSFAANGERGGLLEELCRRDGCGNLLIFAFNSGELFPDVSSSTTDFANTIGGVSLRVTVTRGLREMLAFPDLKKYCWRDLQRLRDRLG